MQDPHLTRGLAGDAVTDAAKGAVEACRVNESVPQGLLDECRPMTVLAQAG